MKRTGKNKAQLIDPVVRLWHKGKPLHLTESGIEEIAQLAEENKNAIVVLDAFASLISGLGLQENYAEAVEPIRFLTEALAPTGATPILLHHSSKSRSHERASNAARGNNALTAEASQIIKLDWLKSDAQDMRVAISTEGRNSKPVDLVVEQIDRAQWISHGSMGSIQQAKKLEEVEEKLSDRQSLALTEVREHSNKCFEGISAKQLSETFPDEFPKQTQALATLNQLEKKGLCLSNKVAQEKRGDVRLYKPHVYPV